ncbi:MAG: FAD-linked oxidase C-terminal domain-containing protein [Gammaproteobacteria bacterium]
MTNGRPHSSERIHHRAERSRLIDEFKTFLPSTSIVSEPEALRPFECDGLSVYRCLPWLVLLPETVEETQRILEICSREGVPVVARGAGTGLSGGAMPLENGVLLNLARLNKIIEIDHANRLARVQSGVRNLEISRAAAKYGLYYAPDPSSQIACTVGGNVAENSGGVHCLKYGLTTHNIVQIKMLTVDGQSVTLGCHGLDGPGLDFLALMTGSEGLLGIVVEVTVRLLPIPEHSEIVLASFDDIEKAGRAVASIIASGLVPAGLEMMDKAAIHAVEAFMHAGYPEDAEAILLCELDGTQAQVEEDLDRACAVLESSEASELRIARTRQDKQAFWAGRKAAFPAVGRISPDYYCMDGTIPRRFLAHVLAAIAELSEKYGLAVANVFHAGDGNLHPLILYDADRPDELERAERFGGEILELCIAVGGTVTGEHGVGVEKIDQMCLQFSEKEIAQLHAVKQGFDEKGLLNPGKAVPSLHRCAELGRMHVHRGALPHPELERF